MEYEVGVRLDRLEALLQRVLENQETIMAVSQDIKDLAAKIDQATTAVAGRIDRLSQKITNSMTDAEVAEVKNALQAEVDRLTAMGQDPANPVPPAP